MTTSLCGTIIIASLLLAGCTASRPPAAVRPAVPFIAQQDNLCGPAALAMVARYYGQPATQEEIARAIYLPAVRGTLTSDLAAYGRRFGFWVRQYRGNLTDLRRKLAGGTPLIVLGRYGDLYHYFVVLDYDRHTDTLTVHTARQAFRRLDLEEFSRAWQRAGYWTLLVCPADPAALHWPLTAPEHNDLGTCLEPRGQVAAALDQYLQAAAAAPHEPRYYFNAGNAFRKLNQPTLAADAWRAAIRLAPDHADARNNLANLLLETGGDLDEAAALCEQAVAGNRPRRAYYLDTLGSIRLRQGRPTEAVAAFEQALAATTDRQAALRAAIEQRLGQARTAIPTHEK